MEILEPPASRAAPSEEPEEEARGTTLAELKATILAGGNGTDGRIAANKLGEALKVLAVSDPLQTRELLQELLDSRQLDSFFDTNGVSCRAAVIDAQLALGFPYALEVNPDDLTLFRSGALRAEALGSTRALKWVSGLSLAWNVAIAVLISGIALTTGSHGIPVAMLATLPFLVGAGHGLTALITAASSKPSRSLEDRRWAARVYRILGWLGLLGPALSALIAVWTGVAGLVIGMLLAAPAMLTALLCVFAAPHLLPEGNEPPDE